MLKENEDYELITHDELPDAWAIRILKGDFVESVIVIGAVALNEIKGHISFNFEIIETPDEDLVHKDNEDLQQYVSQVIEAVIETGLEEGFIEYKERDNPIKLQ